ncbi:3-ketoacyl-CoA thiolase, mitochondrial [Athalia rosae]|uniref:3-ketoacyl-CoA thiolase, mitochondrial n=1 Tax=Athalia rosae TaxID=37344 RepID=UPI0006265876|nr:3-ketoacyl-CoA thiolase, mitochondrial [Athalia rosae]
MSVATKGIFIVAAKRTPFGTLGGKFVNKSATDLQEVAAKAAIAAGGLKPEQIDSVVIGNVLVSSATDGIFAPRHVLLRSGIPLDRPALGVNRLCGSGFQALANGAQSILVGESKIVLTGGVDNMSQAPFVVRGIRFGTTLGQNFNLEDSLWAGLTDTHCQMPMAITAETLGAKYGIKREEVDAFALRSQQLWKAANDAGYFKEELTPVTVQIKKKDVVVDVDEHPRPQTTAEGLAKLPTIFKKNGLVTAGSASGISDGAGAVIVASEEAVKSQGLKPLARLVGYSVVGVEPSIMGIGPAPAIRNLLKITGKTLNDIDLIEINEAFGAQTLACAKELELDMNKLNVNGGAIAVGHPLAASGSRISGHLVHELRRRKAKFGIGSACIGGGQGIAVLIEAL